MALRPVNRRLVVVDIENWSGRPTLVQRDLRLRMTAALDEALAALGSPAPALSSQDRGDGLLLGLDPAVSLLDLTDTFVDRLVTVLRQDRRLVSPGNRMRLRLSIHDGDVTFDGATMVGQAVTEACRLVDARELRAALTANQAADLAVIVSDRVYRSVVAEDLGRVPPEAYQPADVTVKNLLTRAWMHVPTGWRGDQAAPAERPGALAPPGPAPVAQAARPHDSTPGPSTSRDRSPLLMNSPVSGMFVVIGSEVANSFNGQRQSEAPAAGSRQSSAEVPDDGR